MAQYATYFQTDSYVYKLTPPAPGLYNAQWTKTVLYQAPTTTPNSAGVSPPFYGPLAFDRSGAIYVAQIASYYYGAIVKLTPPALGATAWTSATIYAGPFDFQPEGGVIVDASGSLYGVSVNTPVPAEGSPKGYGVVFQLTPPGSGGGSYAYRTLYTFTGGADGAGPAGPLVMDHAGNLFGVTAAGVFELSPPAAGTTTWAFHVIYSYGSLYVPGKFPLTIDPLGNIYVNTVAVTGEHYSFNLSELSPPAAGRSGWTQKSLASLPTYASGLDVVAGDVIVTTYNQILQLAPPIAPATAWTLSTLKTFTNPKDQPLAYTPYAVDSELNLYGGYVCNGCGYPGSIFKLYRTPK